MKRLREKLAMANMVMSIGILLTIVPLAVGVMNIASTAGDNSLGAKALLGWTYFVVIYGLLPFGMALFTGGLGWMVFLRKATKKMDDDEDEE